MPAIIRNDLRDAEFRNPGYLWPIIAPKHPVAQKAGSFYYNRYTAPTAAVTNRDTVQLGKHTIEPVASAQFDYTTGEIAKVKGMGYSEVEGYGGLTPAELVMAYSAKRSCHKVIEDRLAASLLGKAADEDLSAADDLASQIELIARALMPKAPGKLALVLAASNLPVLKNNAEIKDRMKNTGVVLGADGDPRLITEAQLAAACGVDRVLVGLDESWGSVSYKGSGDTQVTATQNAAVVILPEETDGPELYPQLARTTYFKWDDSADIFCLESFREELQDADCVRAKSLVAPETILNSALATVIKLPAA